MLRSGPRAEGAPDVAVLAFGVPVLDACIASEASSGITVDVYDARFAKPIDEMLVRNLALAGVPIVTVEEHSVVGGFGSAVLEVAVSEGFSRITRLGLPDGWIFQASRAEQLAEAGIDVESIGRAIRDAVAPDVRVNGSQAVSMRQGR